MGSCCPVSCTLEMPCAAFTTCDSRSLFFTKETMNPIMTMSSRPMDVASSTLRHKLVFELEALSVSAEESFSRTSLKRWGRKVHCGTRRLSPLLTDQGRARGWGGNIADIENPCGADRSFAGPGW